MPMPAGHPDRLRVVLDATPLLGVRTGIGRYTEHLLAQLAGRPDLSVAATAFTLRGWRRLAAELPSGVPARTRPAPARLLRALWRSVDVPPVEWLAGRADVVHGTNFVLPPSRHAAGVVSVHDLAFVTHAGTLHPANADLSTLVPRALRRGATVCTLAEATRIRISDLFDVPLERIFVAPPGVDQDWMNATAPDAGLRARLDLPADYLVFVGTREPRKGLPTLLAAHRVLRSRIGAACPDLVLIGQQGWGDTHDLHDGVRVAGYLPQGVLPRVVAGARALVLPSVAEGFGMPVIEALAAGCAVVASDIPVLAEATGDAGIRFPVGDVGALADALSRVLDGAAPGVDERRAQAARFTWQRCADQNVAAYRYAATSRG